MEVRRLAESDAAALWHLRLAALRSEPAAFGESAEEHIETTVEDLARRLACGGDENFVLGAFDGPTLAGMVGFYRELRLKRRHRGWIWGMYVAPQWRGQGVARSLLQEALVRARSIVGVRRVLLSVSTTRASARRLYQRLGFEVCGVEREALAVDGRFLDEEHMELSLNG